MTSFPEMCQRIVDTGDSDFLKSHLDSPDPRERMFAILVVQRLKLYQYVPQLRNFLKSSFDGDIADSIVALSTLEDREAYPEIIKFASYPNPEVRSTVPFAIRKLGGEADRAILIRLSRDGDYDTRLNALDVLKFLDEALLQ
ncbi:MAG: HEAT repeat domain-containing protein [Armatimonadetes bacterium]|nr:HEAT repeat domain-containing protein [Armatimonadota bacterium]